MKTLLNAMIFAVTLLVCSNAYSKDYSVWIERCEPYRSIVTEILERESIDKNYYYLMVAESKCTINAESNKGAKGFWQLMPATSRHYGCFNTNNIECSTIAAARYIKHLTEEFDSFNDVIAAYNMGGHNYRRYGMTREARGLVARVNAIRQQDNFTY